MSDIVKLPGRKFYYVRFSINGRAVFRSTKTRDSKKAREFAAMLRENTYNAVLLHPRLAKSVCTIREIWDAYIVAPFGKQRSRRNNLLQLLTIVAPGEDKDSTALDHSAAIIVPTAITRHQMSQLALKTRKNGSINSDVRQGRAVFSRQAVEYYEGLGLVMPSTLDKFMKVRLLKAEDGGYDPIDPAVLAKMDAAIAELKNTNYELWKVLVLVRKLGLRDDEICHAKGKWIIKTSEGIALAIREWPGEFRPKNGIPREILLNAELTEALSGLDAEKSIILPEGKKTPRRNLIYRAANKWIRAYVPDREKGIYELRKQSGSEVATDAPGHLFDAQKFLGHKSYSTTEKYYAKNLNRPKAAGMHSPPAPPAKKARKKGGAA